MSDNACSIVTLIVARWVTVGCGGAERRSGLGCGGKPGRPGETRVWGPTGSAQFEIGLRSNIKVQASLLCMIVLVNQTSCKATQSTTARYGVDVLDAGRWIVV